MLADPSRNMSSLTSCSTAGQGKRRPLQPKSGNKRPRPEDMEERKEAKKAPRTRHDLDTLSELVERTEKTIYSRNQLKRMPRTKLEKEYLALQQQTPPSQRLSDLERQRLIDYEMGNQVPDVVVRICDNYTEITLQLMKMMESAEQDKAWLQGSLDSAHSEHGSLQERLKRAQARITELEDSQKPLFQQINELEQPQQRVESDGTKSVPKSLQEQLDEVKQSREDQLRQIEALRAENARLRSQITMPSDTPPTNDQKT